MKLSYNSGLYGLFLRFSPVFVLVFACESTWRLERENLFTTGQIINIADTNAQVRGEIIDQNLQKPVLSYGHCWSIEPKPDLSDSFRVAELEYSPRTFIITLEQLQPETLYFVRAFVQENGGVRFGEEVQFTTQAERLPFDLQIQSVFNISRNMASAEATVQVNDPSTNQVNIDTYGFVWSTSSLQELGTAGADSTIKVPTGTLRNFTCDLQGLQTDTEYFIRPFLKWRGNTSEISLSYGNEIRFTTSN